MNHWLGYASIAIAMWGVVGLLMKLGTNRISARSMVVWVTIGFLIMVPFLSSWSEVSELGTMTIVVGLLGGLANGLGNWALFVSLEEGAKASVAIPLTALYPLLTVVMATLFLKERMSPHEWLGIMLALAAAAMLSYETAEPNENAVAEGKQ